MLREEGGESLCFSYLFSRPVQLVCLQGMPAGVDAWVKGMNWGKEGWRRSLPHLGDGVKEERETAAGVLLQR